MVKVKGIYSQLLDVTEICSDSSDTEHFRGEIVGFSLIGVAISDAELKNEMLCQKKKNSRSLFLCTCHISFGLGVSGGRRMAELSPLLVKCRFIQEATKWKLFSKALLCCGLLVLVVFVFFSVPKIHFFPFIIIFFNLILFSGSLAKRMSHFST